MNRHMTVTATLAIALTCSGLAAAQNAVPVVAAKQLAKAYADNKTAAVAKYGGKPILLKGTIGRINLNQFGTATMILDGDTMPYGFGLWLREGQDARTVAVGQMITLRCEMPRDNDMAHDCVFVR